VAGAPAVQTPPCELSRRGAAHRRHLRSRQPVSATRAPVQRRRRSFSALGQAGAELERDRYYTCRTTADRHKDPFRYRIHPRSLSRPGDEASQQVLLVTAPLRFPVPVAPPGTACLPPRGPVLKRCELRWSREGSGGLQVRLSCQLSCRSPGAFELTGAQEPPRTVAYAISAVAD